MVMTTLSPKQPGASAAGKRSDRALPKDIWTLALVSLLMGSSSKLSSTASRPFSWPPRWERP